MNFERSLLYYFEVLGFSIFLFVLSFCGLSKNNYVTFHKGGEVPEFKIFLLVILGVFKKKIWCDKGGWVLCSCGF